MIPAELSKHALQHAPSEAHRLEMLAVNLLADEAEATLRQNRQVARAIEKPSISDIKFTDIAEIEDKNLPSPGAFAFVQAVAYANNVAFDQALAWLRAADFDAFELQPAQAA